MSREHEPSREQLAADRRAAELLPDDELAALVREHNGAWPEAENDGEAIPGV
jgi:hypothetical protein